MPRIAHVVTRPYTCHMAPRGTLHVASSWFASSLPRLRHSTLRCVVGHSMRAYKATTWSWLSGVPRGSAFSPVFRAPRLEATAGRCPTTWTPITRGLARGRSIVQKQRGNVPFPPLPTSLYWLLAANTAVFLTWQYALQNQSLGGTNGGAWDVVSPLSCICRRQSRRLYACKLRCVMAQLD